MNWGYYWVPALTNTIGKLEKNEKGARFDYNYIFSHIQLLAFFMMC